MPSYAAFIGHQPHISLAELSASAPGFTLQGIIQKTVVLFEASAPLSSAWLDSLGGTVVLAEEVPHAKTPEEVPELLASLVASVKGKVTFSLRTTGLSPQAVGKLYRQCKDTLKRKGKPARYVGNDHKPAPSVLLHDAGILDGSAGCEICIIAKEKSFWIGKTIGAQDVNAYSKRDMEKPVRDTTVGLLPPKLAQVLLNFGVWLAGGDGMEEEIGKPKGKSKEKEKKTLFTVLDPFCGTGVIPMECLLRGYAVLASDTSEKAINGTQKNIEWMRKHYKILKSVVLAEVWKQDARKPFKLEVLPNVIVTETSLGPNLRERPTSKESQSLRSDNEKLQEDFLKNVAATLPGVPLVCTWPVWFYSKGPVFLERLPKLLDKLGYDMVLPPEIVSVTDRPSLLYRRPDQFVGREIVLLRPRK